MTQPSLLDSPYTDITANRSGSPVTSQLANKKVAPRKGEDRAKIKVYLRVNGKGTLKDIVRVLKIPVQTVSARLSELKATGEVEVTGERRDGCAVLRLTK